jgi:hypothetical protein
MMFRRKLEAIVEGSNIRSSNIDKLLNDALESYDKEYCLDVGVGHDDGGKYTTVDIEKDVGADIVGDIRCCFAASDYYRDMKVEYSDLNKIKPGHFMVVRLKHMIEHVEWIYLPGLFEWVHSILRGGGLVVIDTPNLDYITRVYVDQRNRQQEKKVLRYPAKEYPGLDTGKPGDLQKWVNFKLYSGCSPGDFHHACLNRTLLYGLLERVGFADIGICDGETLRAVAYKVSEDSESLQAIISRQLGGDERNESQFRLWR